MTFAAARLDFADGACWNIVADHPEASAFVERLKDMMQLSSPNGRDQHIFVKVQNDCEPKFEEAYLTHALKAFMIRPFADDPWDEGRRNLKKSISCTLCLEDGESSTPLQLMQFSSLFVLDAITRGGMLLHGALIARNGMGVILAGPGGVGKTTACNRLPETWHTLSDDTALIVRDDVNQYWAHPWPTWSRILLEGVRERWDVGRSISLKAICFLSQSSEPDLVLLGEGEMACLGMEAIEQASRPITRGLGGESLQKLNALHFKNICQLVKAVPGCRLNLDLKSPFYEWIEDRFIKTET
jgi:SynChlorMet cassette protein ScmC